MSVATHVRISDGPLVELAELLRSEPEPPQWGSPHLAVADGFEAETVAGWTLLLSALNFCFWQDEPRWRVQGRDGYMALAHALRRAFDSGVPVAMPSTWASWSVDGFASVLRGDDATAPLPPMVAERHAVAAELGAWVVTSFGGSALRAVSSAPSAAALASSLADSLRGFRDVAEYRGRRVPFLKRAQIAAHDCGAALGSPVRSGLTAFADYKLPQVLRACGALVYSAPLAAAVDARIELASGSEEEVEIRAATVVAVDRLASLLALDAPRVDTLLWWRGQGLRAQPYHRVRTIWY